VAHQGIDREGEGAVGEKIKPGCDTETQKNGMAE
jgi:hypothetical protein